MPADETAALDPEEVKRELERIRKSNRFRRVGKAFELLQYLVKGYLEGKEFTQEQIAADVYKKKGDDWSPIIDSDARTGRNHLQGYLGEYYEKEGSKNPLIIEVPLGTMYRAACSRNPRYVATERYLLGRRKLDELFLTCGREIEPPFGFARPVEPEIEFDQALQTNPNYAPALAARAEARLIRLLLWSDRPREYSLKAETDSYAAWRADENYWPAWVLIGASYCCQSEWKKASAVFEYVEKNAPAEARESLWYLLFLVARGRAREAVELSECRLGNHLDDSISWMIAGFVHYLTRHYEKAKKNLLEACRICSEVRRENWFALFLLACTYLAVGEADKALPLLQRSGRVWFVQGFLVQCLTSEGRRGEAEKLLQSFSLYPGSVWIPPMQVAIAHMAVGGEVARVIGSLEFAYVNHDPWIMLLNTWPIFDPLRKRKEFRMLLKKVQRSEREWHKIRGERWSPISGRLS